MMYFHLHALSHHFLNSAVSVTSVFLLGLARFFNIPAIFSFNISFLAVIEHAYQLGNATQKQELLMELYSTELQLFKDLVTMKENRYMIRQYFATGKSVGFLCLIIVFTQCMIPVCLSSIKHNSLQNKFYAILLFSFWCHIQP